MNIVDAFKKFAKKLTGFDVTGDTIDEVINNASNQCVNVSTVNTNLNALDAVAIKYEDDNKKSLVLNSSTAESIKQFRITVDDTGAITATEIVAESAE